MYLIPSPKITVQVTRPYARDDPYVQTKCCSESHVKCLHDATRLHTTYSRYLSSTFLNDILNETSTLNAKEHFLCRTILFGTLVIKWLITAPIRLHGCTVWSGPSYQQPMPDVLGFCMGQKKEAFDMEASNRKGLCVPR